MNLIPLEAHMEFVTLTILVPRLIVNYNGSFFYYISIYKYHVNSYISYIIFYYNVLILVHVYVYYHLFTLYPHLPQTPSTQSHWHVFLKVSTWGTGYFILSHLQLLLSNSIMSMPSLLMTRSVQQIQFHTFHTLFFIIMFWYWYMSMCIIICLPFIHLGYPTVHYTPPQG
jgi:hypothetical protein